MDDAVEESLRVPRVDLPAALAEIGRVLRPDGLLYWGQYGGVDHQGPLESDPYEPKRFFSLLSDQALTSAGPPLFRLERFDTIPVSKAWEQHFQSSIWRRTAFR